MTIYPFPFLIHEENMLNFMQGQTISEPLHSQSHLDLIAQSRKTCFNLFAKFARSWRNDSIRFTILSSTASRLEFNFLFLNFTVSTILLIS